MDYRTLQIAMIDPSAFTIPYDVHLCRGLGEEGQKVTLFTRVTRTNDYYTAPGSTSAQSQPFTTEQHFYRNVERSRLVQSAPRLRTVYKAVEHIRDMRSLLRRLDSLRPDVIHFQWIIMPAVDAQFVKKLRKIAPVVLTIHDAEAFHAPTSKFQLLGWANSLKVFDGLIVHTQQTRRSLESSGVQSDRIACVPHGLLHHAPATAAAIVPSRAASDVCRLLLFGSIKPYKGLTTLLEALSLLPADTRTQVRLTVAGKPQVSDASLHSLAKDYGVQDLVDWRLGYVQDHEVGGLFEASDVVVFPYHRIDASGALMASLPFKKAIVASRLGQFAELLSDGDSALLVEPGEPRALASALRKVVEDAQLRASLACGVARVAGNVASWNEIARQTVEFYHSLVPR